MSSFFDDGAERKSSDDNSDLVEIEDKLAQSTVPDLSPNKNSGKEQNQILSTQVVAKRDVD
jgi:hypothetical protein